MPLELLADIEAACAEHGYIIRFANYKGERTIAKPSIERVKEEVSLSIIKKEFKEKK